MEYGFRPTGQGVRMRRALIAARAAVAAYTRFEFDVRAGRAEGAALSW